MTNESNYVISQPENASELETLIHTALVQLKRKAPANLRKLDRALERREKRLRKRWRKPLNLLEMFVSLATEAGTQFNDEFRNDAIASGDAVLEALTRIHAKGCQIASAIFSLLRSGYADQAHAQWRSLHELSVVSSMISEYGQAIAERYIRHDVVERYKLAVLDQEFAERLGGDPLPAEEFAALKARRDELVVQFGKEFGEDYGWAAYLFDDRAPDFGRMEKKVGLDHWRPYYKMASDNVHPNAHGVYYRLGLSVYPHQVLLAGPSDMGLADPGHQTAISLCQLTINLLNIRPTASGGLRSEVMLKLEDEVGAAFLRVHRRMETLADHSDDAEKP